jgi:TonB-linked SusC/RagA family outer membrane protein
MRKLVLLLMCFSLAISQLYAQNRTVSGKITDDKGNPVPGATVSVVGTKINVVADEKGSFSVSVPNSARSIEVTSTGFKATTVSIAGKSSVEVKLATATSELDEVVVTGLGKQKKAEYSGAVARVSGAEIRNVPIATFEQMLQGKAAGVTVLNGSGQPGNPANVTIRGQLSITSGATPLYVVDGMPVEASVFQGINPNDIENIEVLKDASSAAIYGSRGAAGVIVVTTRRGSSGKIKVTYSGQFGTKSKPTFNYDMMNTTELFATQEALGKQLGGNIGQNDFGLLPNMPGWQYSRNNPIKYVGGAPQPKTAADFLFGDRYLDSLKNISVNWDDAFFRTGTFSNQEVNISGGTGRTRFFSSLGIYDEQGLIRRSDLKRYTLRNNIDYADDKFKMSVSSNIGYTIRNFQESTVTNSTANPFLASRITPGYIAPYKADGTWNNGAPLYYAGPNTLNAMEFNEILNDQIKMTLGFDASYKIIKNVTAGFFAGADFRETQATTYRHPRAWNNSSSADIRTRSGSITESLGRFWQYNMRGSLGWAKNYNNIHDVEITGYAEFLKTKQKNFSMQGFGVDEKRPNTPAATTQGNAGNQLFAIVGGGKSERALTSLFGTGRYTFKKKYTLNASYRYDGASNLAEDNRFQGFYSVGVTWDATKENFLAGKKNINTLRVKASYGQSANNDNFALGDFGYLPTYGQGGYQGLQTVVVAGIGNQAALWEYTNTLNIGIDFGFFQNRFYGDIQLYDRRTENLYARNSLSATGGLGIGSFQDVNAGELQNKGFEYNLNYDIVKNTDITWSVNVNGAYNRNRVLSLGNTTAFERGTELVEVGKPLGSHYNVGWAGVDQATGKPLYYDLAGNVTDQFLASARRNDWGTWQAPWTGGFGSSLRVGGFDVSALFNWQKESIRLNNLEFFVENPGFVTQGFGQARSFNMWQKPGDVASTQSGFYQNQFSSKYLQDASFLRLRNITLSYTLPQATIAKLKYVSNVRFYVLGQNLATWTKWKGYDPEDDNNISLSEYPNPRSYTAGVQITF